MNRRNFFKNAFGFIASRFAAKAIPDTRFVNYTYGYSTVDKFDMVTKMRASAGCEKFRDMGTSRTLLAMALEDLGEDAMNVSGKAQQ